MSARQLTADEKDLVAHCVAAVTLHNSPLGLSLLAERIGSVLARFGAHELGRVEEIKGVAQDFADAPTQAHLSALRRAVNRYFVGLIDGGGA